MALMDGGLSYEDLFTMEEQPYFDPWADAFSNSQVPQQSMEFIDFLPDEWASAFSNSQLPAQSIPTIPGAVYLDTQTGQFVSFEDIMRTDPAAAFDLDPAQFLAISDRGGVTPSPTATASAPSGAASTAPTTTTSGTKTPTQPGVLDQIGGFAKSLAPLAPLAAMLAGGGLAAGGLASGGGKLRNPSVDPQAQQLIDLISQQANLQNKLLTDTLKGSEFQDEAKLRSLGVQNLTDILSDPEYVSKLFGGEDAVRKEANAQLLAALQRGSQASPELLNQFADEERKLIESFRETQGTGYESGTPFRSALAEFNKRKLEALADDALFRKGTEMNLLSGLALPRGQLLDQTANTAVARNTAATNSNATTDALMKVLQATAMPASSAGLGLGALQQNANNLLDVQKFNLTQANQNRNSLLSGGGQLLGYGLYSLGRKA